VLALKEESAGSEETTWIAEPVWNAEAGRAENLDPRNAKDRRSGIDRRKTARPVVRYLFRGGKREMIRRLKERNSIFLADRYSQTLFGAILLILFFSASDGLLTLFLIDHNATELNPVMAYYLNVGPYAFFCVKYLLTSVAVVVLLLYHDVFLPTIRMYTRTLFYVIAATFMSAVMWELFLIFYVVTC